MVQRLYAHTGNGTWVLLDPTVSGKHLYAYDGSNSVTGWRDIQVGYVYDGSNSTTGWRKFWEVAIDPTVDSSTVVWDDNNDVENADTVNCGCECSSLVPKYSNCVCVKWNHTACVDANHHVDIMQSTGGSYTVSVEGLACNEGAPVWCRDLSYDGEEVAPSPTTCWTGSTRYVKVRIAADVGNGLLDEGSAHGPYNMTNCGAAV